MYNFLWNAAKPYWPSWLSQEKTMFQDMLGPLVRALITVPDDRLGLVLDFANKAKQGRGRWIAEAKRFLREEVCWSARPELFELILTVTIPARTQEFVAKDRFVVNTGRRAAVKICGLNAEFTEWFLSASYRESEDCGEGATLYGTRSRRFADDITGVAQFGAVEDAETTLREMWSLIEMQGNGQAGALLNNNEGNIFYIKDQGNILRKVLAYYKSDKGGWEFFAIPLGHSGGIRPQNRVFFHSSIFEA